MKKIVIILTTLILYGFVSLNAMLDDFSWDKEKRLKYAIIHGDIKLMQLLLEAKANPNTESNGTPLLVIATTGCEGRYGSIYASRAQREAMVKLLLAHKANVNAYDKHEHRTALLDTMHFNSPSLVQFLLANHADVSHCDKTGHNALFETMRVKSLSDCDKKYLTHLVLNHHTTTDEDVRHAYCRRFMYDALVNKEGTVAYQLTSAREYAYECSRIELRDALKKFARENGLQEKLVPGIIDYIADYAALYHHISNHQITIKEYRDNPKSKQLIVYQGS
jgi:hemerythrin-like domain-containing protein